MGTKGSLKRKSAENEVTKKKKKKIHEKSLPVNVNYLAEENRIEDISENSVEEEGTFVFSSLKEKVSENTLKAIENMGLTNMEKIQKRCILPLLEGKDLVGTIKTNSKTKLSFLIPAVESINKIKAESEKGTGCIIISSTRETALQIFGTLKELLQFHQHTCCLLVNGSDRKTEARKLSRGINVIVATPERLLYHLENTPNFMYKNLEMLILAETDRLLETGFETNLKRIISILPKKRQTVLFMKEKINIDELVTSEMKTNAIHVDEEIEKEEAIEGLEEGYVLAPSEKRFHFLMSFLEKNKSKKVIVLLSSSLSTKHHYDLLTSLDVPVSSIHGKQKQIKRTSIFSKFCESSTGVLLCADATTSEVVFPKVDWILQYDPPENPKEHINRLREITKDSRGKSVLVLSPEEIGFLSYLKEAGISTYEFKISWNKIKNIQLPLEKLISKNYFMHLSAKEAFKAFVKSYDSHQLKEIFNIKTLDLGKVAKCFGFTVTPAVDLSITEEFVKNARPEKRRGGGGYGFFKAINNTSEEKQIKIFDLPKSKSKRKQIGKRKNLRKISR